MKFHNFEKIRGERIVRQMSEKAQKFYNENEDIVVYVRDDLIYTTGMITLNGVSLKECEKEFEKMQDMFAE